MYNAGLHTSKINLNYKPLNFFFFLRILSIFNTHTHGERGEGFFKETYSSVYPKGPNSWIHSTSFKSL